MEIRSKVSVLDLQRLPVSALIDERRHEKLGQLVGAAATARGPSALSVNCQSAQA
jgi:hypothetical protein